MSNNGASVLPDYPKVVLVEVVTRWGNTFSVALKFKTQAEEVDFSSALEELTMQFIPATPAEVEEEF